MTTQTQSPSYPADWKPVRHWKQIAEEASKEQDCTKLMELVNELLQALSREPVQGMIAAKEQLEAAIKLPRGRLRPEAYS